MKHVDFFCEIESLQTGLHFQSTPVTCNGTVDLQESLSHQLYVGPGGMPISFETGLGSKKCHQKHLLQGFKRNQETPFFQVLRGKCMEMYELLQRPIQIGYNFPVVPQSNQLFIHPIFNGEVRKVHHSS